MKQVEIKVKKTGLGTEADQKINGDQPLTLRNLVRMILIYEHSQARNYHAYNAFSNLSAKKSNEDYLIISCSRQNDIFMHA